jgi:thioredoxin-related protein
LTIKYKIKQMPALIFFNNGNLIGKVEGYFEIKDEDNLKNEINKIMKK